MTDKLGTRGIVGINRCKPFSLQFRYAHFM
jgi:hypothetical protein